MRESIHLHLRCITIGAAFLSVILMFTGVRAAPTIYPTAPPASDVANVSTPAHHTAVMNALRSGNIRDAYLLLEQIETPAPADLAPLSMGVRLMLDHLYLVDVTDLQMPLLNARMERALALADKAIAADPAAPDGWGAKALALNWAYRSREALILIRSARSQHPEHAGLMVVEAEILAQLADYAGASALIAEVIGMMGADSGAAAVARAHYVAGNIAQILGQTQVAIDAYELAWAISRQPFDETRPWNTVPPGYILYQLGPIYLFEGREQEALAAYTAAMQIDRQDAFLYYLSGRIYRYIGNPLAAEREFRQCLALEADQLRCMRNLGQMAFEAGRWQDTIGWLRPIIDAQSQISDDHYYLAAAYVEAGNCEQAMVILERGALLLLNATGNPYWNGEDYAVLRERCT
jgi:tetratricopeptide (TPR) repeat protein